MEQYTLGLYEKALPSLLSIQEKLEIAGTAGFDYLELSIDESDEKLARLDYGAAERRAVQHAVNETGVRIRSMCLSGHRKYPFGSHDAATREKSMMIMRKAIDLAEDLGIRLIQLAGYDVYYEESDAFSQSAFGENLQCAVQYAAAKGILLGFETMETPFMDTVEKAMRYVRFVDSPYLGVYPDIGNLNNAAILYKKDIELDIEQGRGHIFAAHLKETRPGIYRNLFFGDGCTEYDRCLNTLIGQGVRMFVGEFWYLGNADYRTDIRNAACFLRERIERSLSELSCS